MPSPISDRELRRWLSALPEPNPPPFTPPRLPRRPGLVAAPLLIGLATAVGLLGVAGWWLWFSGAAMLGPAIGAVVASPSLIRLGAGVVSTVAGLAVVAVVAWPGRRLGVGP